MRWIAILLFVLSAACALAQDRDAAAGVIVRQSVDTKAGTVIGQRIPLYVDVLFPDAMSHPPQVFLPEIAGLQAFRFETQATTLSETLAGRTYVGQRFEFALFARRGGRFEVPAARVTLLDRAGDPIGEAAGTASVFTATVPPGLDPAAPVVASRRLVLDQSWSPDPGGGFMPGDALVRTIIRTVEDVPALALAELPLSAPDSVRAYAAPPQSEDRTDRGDLTGRRTDRITYVFERAGRFVLPALSQSWWDLDAGQAKQATGDGIEIAVAPSPDGDGAERGADSSGPGWRWFALGLAAAVLSGAVLAVLVRGRASRSNEARQEHHAFRDLMHACARLAPAATYHAFCCWRSHFAASERGTISPLGLELEHSLFGGDRPGAIWTAAGARRLAAAARQTRKQLQGKSAHEGPPQLLPPLN